MKMRSGFLITATAAAIISSGVLFETLTPTAEAQQGDTLRVDTVLVQVDVVVRGEGGVVAGLNQNDFTLRDDGTEQEIAVFGVTRSGAMLDPTPLPNGVVSNRIDVNGRQITTATIILLDRLNTPIQHQTYAIQELKKLLESTSNIGRVALYELRRDLSVTIDYTGDSGRLYDVVANLEPEQSLALANSETVGGFESTDSVGLDSELAEFAGRSLNSAAVAVGGPTVASTGAPSARLERATKESGEYQLDVRARATALAMEALAQRLAGLPGRKNIVWLSSRYPFSLDIYSESDLVGEIEPETVRQIERASIALTDANVAVYPVNAGGSGTILDQQMGLTRSIAQATGGRAFPQSNDVAGAIREAAQDTAVTYTLGFYTSVSGIDGEFHELEVDVPAIDVETRHRGGYYARPGPGTEGGAPPIPVSEILLNPLDATALSLTAGANPSRSDDGSHDLIMMIGVAGLSLTEDDGQFAGEFEVALGFEPEGGADPTIFPSQIYPISLTEEQYQAALQTGFVYRQTIQTDGENGRFRVAVQNTRNGASGSLWVPVGVR
jgi:VWFA-related protein